MDQKATSVYFLLPKLTHGDINLQGFEEYLKDQGRLKSNEFKTLQFSSKDHDIQTEVRFYSINKAKRVYRILRKRNPNIQISLQGFSSVSIQHSIDKLKDNMKLRGTQYTTSHDEKIRKLEMKLDALYQQSRRLALNEFERITNDIQAVKSELDERSKQKSEFERACARINARLMSLEGAIDSTRKPLSDQVEQLQMHFARECIRLHNSLPIYAKRQAIIEAVFHNQVVIIIGETGSGKSTQVVQYLYDAGYAADGKSIVCTQPRKVAAVSLANRVSTEMCSSPGGLVGYQLGVGGKFSNETRVLYMTDHTLLNECIADRLFSKYSCLVIDEAHERSLSTDILLACIKQCLPYRGDLKVIITSATIDPELFVKYFGNCPIVKVSGRMFPVDVIWNPLNTDATESLISRDIVLDTVKVANDIHKREPEGDILVFLTSPLQIENACQLAVEEMGEEIIVALPLHGKLQPQEQRQVFEVYQGKRKIVFSTNIAETSVTIPGIKYIIDTGLAKELCFDAKRNMNSLEVRMISKSSAEQRKGRAGRTSSGKCYRLYTQEQYEGMPNRTLPEILRMHLIHAVLKLYEFGISDVLSFDFVEKPDEATLRAAVDTLAFLGAVNGNKLTELGQRLALLPIDPQLGKVLLDGIKENIGLEAAVSASISSHGGTVFFRGGTDEMKSASDLMKVKFLHLGGDQMTCLSVYKEWSLCKKAERNKWCVENYINAKAMRIIEETVKDLRHILLKSFQIELPNVFHSLSNVATVLPKIYFFNFLRNLAVYLGHTWVGYMTLQLQDEPLVFFPGSSLAQNNLTPRYIVYEKTLKTSKHFLLQVISADEAWIAEAIEQGSLSQSALDNIKKYQVTPFALDNIGQVVYGRAIKKNIQGLRERMIALCKSPLVQVEMAPSEGLLRVFSRTIDHNILKSFLLDEMQVVRNELKKGFMETGVTDPQDDVKVVMGQGGLIEHVLMPHHFRTIVIKGPVTSDWIDDAQVGLLEQGEIILFQYKDFKNETRIYATFSHPETAASCVTDMPALLPEGVTIQPLLPKASDASGFRLFRLKIEWTRREKKNFAFVDFDSATDFCIAYSSLASRQILVQESLLRFRPSKTSPTQIFVSNVGRFVTEEGISRMIEMETGGIKGKVKLGLEKCHVTTDMQYEALEHQLITLLSDYAPRHQFNVNLLRPADQHVVFRAFVDFQNPEVGQLVMNSLINNNHYISGKQLKIQVMLSSSVRFKPQVYEVIADEFCIVKQQIKAQFQNTVKLSDKKDRYSNFIVEISSDNIEAFGIAKRELNNLIQPKVIECRSPYLQQYIFSVKCKEMLTKLQHRTQTIIITNTRSMTISIYGTITNRLQAAEHLNEEINQIERKGLRIHEIRLHGSSKPPGLMKHLISQFGSDLGGMIQIEGIESASIEPRRQILTVLSTDEAFKQITQIMENFSSTSQVGAEAKECSICYCEIEDVTDMYILEYCGHASHIECIQLQVSSTAATFPILCAAEGCSHPFVWQDFENLFKKTSLTLASLVNSSLKSYLGANKDKVRNCPSPDCQMVYVVSDNGQRFVCCQCNVHICTTCHVQFHDGLTCAMYKSQKSGDGSLEKWLQGDCHNRKLCPKCSAPIEKNKGCNHICCLQCKSHICWVCLRYFGTCQLCYAHLALSHGGFQ